MPACSRCTRRPWRKLLVCSACWDWRCRSSRSSWLWWVDHLRLLLFSFLICCLLEFICLKALRSIGSGFYLTPNMSNTVVQLVPLVMTYGNEKGRGLSHPWNPVGDFSSHRLVAIHEIGGSGKSFKPLRKDQMLGLGQCFSQLKLEELTNKIISRNSNYY